MTDKEKIRKYEAAYSDIQAYIKRANAAPAISIFDMYDEVTHLLDEAFGSDRCKGNWKCWRRDTELCAECALPLCPDCMSDMQNHDWIGHNDARR